MILICGLTIIWSKVEELFATLVHAFLLLDAVNACIWICFKFCWCHTIHFRSSYHMRIGYRNVCMKVKDVDSTRLGPRRISPFVLEVRFIGGTTCCLRLPADLSRSDWSNCLRAPPPPRRQDTVCSIWGRSSSRYLYCLRQQRGRNESEERN